MARSGLTDRVSPLTPPQGRPQLFPPRSGGRSLWAPAVEGIKAAVATKQAAHGGGLTPQIIQGQNDALFLRRLEIFLLEPEQAHGQLPQVISFVTDWQLAGLPQRVGGMIAKR